MSEIIEPVLQVVFPQSFVAGMVAGAVWWQIMLFLVGAMIKKFASKRTRAAKIGPAGGKYTGSETASGVAPPPLPKN